MLIKRCIFPLFSRLLVSDVLLRWRPRPLFYCWACVNMANQFSGTSAVFGFVPAFVMITLISFIQVMFIGLVFHPHPTCNASQYCSGRPPFKGGEKKKDGGKKLRWAAKSKVNMSSAPELVAESSWESPGLAADFVKNTSVDVGRRREDVGDWSRQMKRRLGSAEWIILGFC